jgi:hypothetical protein
VYVGNGPLDEEFLTLTVTARPLQLPAGTWEKWLASQYTKPSMVPAAFSGWSNFGRCNPGAVIVRFGAGAVCDTRCAEAGIFTRIASRQVARINVRMSDSPPELRHEYPDLGRRSKEMQIKRR